MDFFFFNLMPYGALDLNYDKEFSSANLVLPNSYYDPEEGHKLYTRYLDELEYADEVTLGRSITNRIPFESSIKI